MNIYVYIHTYILFHLYLTEDFHPEKVLEGFLRLKDIEYVRNYSF
jgi:hypothetical protein